jgi:hypothetical protein
VEEIPRDGDRSRLKRKRTSSPPLREIPSTGTSETPRTKEQTLVAFEKTVHDREVQTQGREHSSDALRQPEIPRSMEIGRQESFPSEHFNTMKNFNTEILREIRRDNKISEEMRSDLRRILTYRTTSPERLDDNICLQAAKAWKKIEQDANNLSWDQLPNIHRRTDRT